MAEIRVESERTIDAPQSSLFKLLADYESGRPRILPPSFQDWRVVRGGLGGGTAVTYRLVAARRERAYEIEVEEETVGSVLVERDKGSSLMTTWTLTPDGPARTRVVVATRWKGSDGLGGFFERRFAPLGLRRVYDDLLERLEQVAAELAPPPADPEEARQAPPAVEFPEGFLDDLRQPVGPTARKAQVSATDQDGSSANGTKATPSA